MHILIGTCRLRFVLEGRVMIHQALDDNCILPLIEIWSMGGVLRHQAPGGGPLCHQVDAFLNSLVL